MNSAVKGQPTVHTATGERAKSGGKEWPKNESDFDTVIALFFGDRLFEKNNSRVAMETFHFYLFLYKCKLITFE